MTVKKNIVWVVVSCLMILSLVMASCGPAAEEEEEEEEEIVIGEEEEEEEEEEVAPGPEVPKYGGTFTAASDRDVEWDPTGGYPKNTFYYVGLWYEHLLHNDWARGPAGSNEYSFQAGFSPYEYMGGTIAESWELPNPNTWIFQIRQGVHWALDPNSEASRLMNGRELTADDVVWTFKRGTTSKNSTLFVHQPDVARESTMEKTGPWEVTLKVPADPMVGFTWIVWGGGWFQVVPREVVEKYGDLMDWHNVVGTGPYMVKDWVRESSLTIKRNPNYWDKDPVGPGKGNQLPYIETAKFLIVPDWSTRLAAVRTAKADWITNVAWEDAQSLMKTTPTLESVSFVSLRAMLVGMRKDKQDLPYKDERVRRALTMAIDFNTIKKDFFSDEADLISWPVNTNFAGAYVPLEEMSASIQELFSHNPDKAKQLLAEAGYPSGFKSTMFVSSDTASVDAAQILKEYWAEVGVDVELLVRDPSTLSAISTKRSHDEMILSTQVVTYGTYLMGATYRGIQGNTSYINDPPGSDTFLEDRYQEVQKHVLVNMPEANRIFREQTVPYLLDGAYMIQIPKPYTYTLWYPWLKNYHGEQGSASDTFDFVPHIWIDQDLKAQMTRSR